MRLSAIAVAAAILFLSGCSTSPTAPLPPQPPLSSVSVSPGSDTLRVGETVHFSATAVDTGGMVVTVTLKWTSLDPAVFTVDVSGRVRGVSEGTALLRVSAGGQSDTAQVTVITARNGWYAQASNTTSNLRNVFFLPDGHTGWAVGDASTILATTDAGATWKTQPNPAGVPLRGVWFTSALEGWVVGGSGCVLHTVDGGDNWTRLFNTGTNAELMDVCFADPDTGWAVGSGGLILSTFDRGATWTRMFPTSATLRSVSFAGTRDGWAVGDGTIAGTHDGGRSWFLVLPSVTANAIYGVSRRSEPMAVAVGAQGVVPRTVAGPDSTTWQLGTAGAFNQLYGVHFPTDMTGYAVGFNTVGRVLRTDDGGMTWQEQTANAQFRLNGVYFLDEMRGWAVGAAGVILHTGTGGEL